MLGRAAAQVASGTPGGESHYSRLLAQVLDYCDRTPGSAILCERLRIAEFRLNCHRIVDSESKNRSAVYVRNAKVVGSNPIVSMA